MSIEKMNGKSEKLRKNKKINQKVGKKKEYEKQKSLKSAIFYLRTKRSTVITGGLRRHW